MRKHNKKAPIKSEQVTKSKSKLILKKFDEKVKYQYEIIDLIETAKEALKEALKGEDIEAIKARQEDLQKEIFAISEKIYKAANPQGDPNAAGPQDAGNADPNVYEADFTDVDDNK